MIDGEHIEKDKYNNHINYYAAFDIYYCSIKKRNGVDIRSYKFFAFNDETTSDEEKRANKYTRYRLLDKVIKEINGSLNKNSKNNLTINKKTFIFSNPNKNISIFDCCTTLLVQLIQMYINILRMVLYLHQWYWELLKNILVILLNKNMRGNIVLSETSEYNTIDFLIEIKKNKLNDLDLKTKMINGEIHQYYEINLKIGLIFVDIKINKV